MDSAKYVEPLVRRAVTEKFPESLHTMIEILKRAPGGAGPSATVIPGIGENLADAIRQLIFDNIFTIKGNPMDPITELDVIQRLAENLETKKDYVELVFPPDNRNVHSLFSKLISYAVSLKGYGCLRKCARLLKALDVMHPMRIAVVNTLRADFCQISNLNVADLLDLPHQARDMAFIFVSTLFSQPALQPDASLYQVVSQWLSTDYDLLSMLKMQTACLVRWNLLTHCLRVVPEQASWKLHLAILENFQYRANLQMRGVKKHGYLSGNDVKLWVECLQGCPNSTQSATDMLLQIIQVAKQTGALHMTAEEMQWCMKNIVQTEFSSLIDSTELMEIT